MKVCALAGAIGKGAEEMATLHTQGQPHDRIQEPPGNGDLNMPAAPKPAIPQRPVEADTSITQKMLSAVSGSVLTSLLSKKSRQSQ